MGNNQENKAVFFYGETTPKKKTKARRVTVAGVLDDKTKSILVGVAICSDKDRFVKSVGRIKAVSRAQSRNPFDVLEMPDEKPINYFIEEAKKIISEL